MQGFYELSIPQRPRFSSNTEHLLQIGNSHLKHLYLGFMTSLCDVSNDFLQLAIPGREIVFLQRMLVKGGNSIWQVGEYIFL